MYVSPGLGAFLSLNTADNMAKFAGRYVMATPIQSNFPIMQPVPIAQPAEPIYQLPESPMFVSKPVTYYSKPPAKKKGAPVYIIPNWPTVYTGSW